MRSALRTGGHWGVTLVYENDRMVPEPDGRVGKFGGSVHSRALADYICNAVEMYQAQTGKPIPEPPDL
jgi:hypothetical protein